MSPTGSKNAPEAKAREKIDGLLAEAGWIVQDREDMNLAAGDGVAVCEFTLEKGHGCLDYLLFVDSTALGVVEAKPAGYSFTSVEVQAKKYVEGLPASLTAPQKPLPFAYISTGEETVFINELDPQPRSRPVFTFHRPETLRARLRAMPPVDLPGMWPNKVQAIANLETSLLDDRPRALIQMATGSGKSLMATTVHEAWTGLGWAQLHCVSQVDPWHKLKVKEVVAAQYQVSDMILGHGEIVKTY